MKIQPSSLFLALGLGIITAAAITVITHQTSERIHAKTILNQDSRDAPASSSQTNTQPNPTPLAAQPSAGK